MLQNTKDKRNSEKGYASTDLRVADFLQHRRCQAGVARHDGAAREQRHVEFGSRPRPCTSRVSAL